jgi:hypothetical protein
MQAVAVDLFIAADKPKVQAAQVVAVQDPRVTQVKQP